MSIKKKLKGPIFSIITPFKKNEEIDYEKLSKYIDYLYLRGARIFYVMVYNSRLGLLNYSEVINLNIFCIKKVKKIDKNNVIICAEPYHCSTQQSIELANLFKKKGADIISLILERSTILISRYILILKKYMTVQMQIYFYTNNKWNQDLQVKCIKILIL